MTQLEFALKNFKRGTKIVITETSLIYFFVGEIFFDVHETDKNIVALLHKSNEDQSKSDLESFGIGCITGEKPVFNCYLITEEYK